MSLGSETDCLRYLARLLDREVNSGVDGVA
jgi:hypothetical protein